MAAQFVQVVGSLLEFLVGHLGTFLFALLVYGLLWATSGYVVRGVLWYAGVESPGSDDGADTGTAIGKVENAIVLSLVLVEAYTALGIVFAAKSLVRAQDTASGDTTYYLTGTLTNFAYSLLYGAVFRAFLDASGTSLWSI